MAQRRHHYERAFESFLRERRIPYISVDEARKALLPDGARFNLAEPREDGAGENRSLKSFDFIVYGQPGNLLIDIKGRRIPPRAGGVSTGRRLESWVTQGDIDSLETWERLFGDGFSAAFVFLYLCEGQPPDALFQEVFEDRGRWYAIRAISLGDYRRCMRVRSPRWRTVHLATADFERLSRPFTGVCEPVVASRPE